MSFSRVFLFYIQTYIFIFTFNILLLDVHSCKLRNTALGCHAIILQYTIHLFSYQRPLTFELPVALHSEHIFFTGIKNEEKYLNNILTTTQHIKAAGTTIVWVRQAQQYQEYITAVGPTTEKLQVMVGVVKVSGHFSQLEVDTTTFLNFACWTI